MKKIVLCVLSFASVAACAAPEVWVAENGDDTTGKGTSEKPYATIATGVANCDANGTVWIKKGRYTAGTGATELKTAMTIRGETDDPWDVVIDMRGGYGPTFIPNNKDLLIANLAVTNTLGDYAGTAFRFVGQGGTVSNCVTYKCHGYQNTSFAESCAVWANAANALITHCQILECDHTKGDQKVGAVTLKNNSKIRKCLIANCTNVSTAEESAGGLAIILGSAENCTIVGCTGNKAGGLEVSSGSAKNMIVAGNTSTGAGSAYNDINPNHVSRVTASASTPESSLGEGCVKDLAVNFYENLLSGDYAKGDYRPAANPPVNYGYYDVDLSEPKVTMKVDKVAGLSPLTVNFLADVQGFADGDEVTYAWDFGGGTSESADSKIATATFTPGTFDVSLTVKNLTTGLTYTDVKRGLVVVAPGTLYVKKDNASAAFPYADENTAAASLADALAAAGEGSAIRILPGRDLSGLTVNKGVAIVGVTGNPEDVVFKNQLTLGFPGISLSGVTIAGATSGNSANLLLTGDGCVVSNCVIRNHPANNGNDISPVKTTGANSFMTHCIITNNTMSSQSFGTVFYSRPAGLSLGGQGSVCANTLIAFNKTSAVNGGGGEAGGVVLFDDAKLVNCTVVGNKGPALGGVKVANENARVINCAIAANTATSDDSDLDNVDPADEAYILSSVATDDTRIFLSYGTGDYSPGGGSPLIDEGDGTVADIPAKDLAGKDRVMGNGLDIGAYEYDPSQMTVSISVEKTDYLTPAKAEVHANCSAPDTDDLVYTWTLVTGTHEVTAVVTNNPDALIDLDVSGRWDVTVEVEDLTTKGKCRATIPGLLLSAPGTLYVKAGNPDAVYPYDTEEGAAPTLAAAIEAAMDGSTIYLRGSEKLSGMTVEKSVALIGATGNPEDAIFKSCLTLSSPGIKLFGVTVEGGKDAPNLSLSAADCVVSNCVVRNHQSNNGYDQPAIVVGSMGQNCQITHCVVSNNAMSASAFNGEDKQPAALSLSGSGSVCANTLFLNNRTTAANQSALTLDGDVRLVNCTIVGNTGGKIGGAKVKNANARVVNCAVAGNRAANVDSDWDNADPADEALYSHCVVTSDTSIFLGYETRDFTPSAGSALVDAADEAVDIPAKDLAGNDRVMGVRLDIGAYELDPSRMTVSISADVKDYILPARVSVHANCNVPEGDSAVYCWTFVNGTSTATAVATDDPDIAVDLTVAGKWTVSVSVTNTATEAYCQTTVPDFLTLAPKTVYVIKGNAGAAYPYDTEATAAADILTAAKSLMIAGQEVVIAPETYLINSGVTLSMGVTVRGATGNPADVVIDRNNGGIAFTLSDPQALLTGVSVTRGSTGAGGGAGVNVNNGCVSNCIVRSCSSNGSYDSAAVYASGRYAVVSHCVISNNTATGGTVAYRAAGLQLLDGARAENCLVVDNRYSGTLASVATAGGIIVRASSMADAPSRLINCTVFSNACPLVGGLFAVKTANNDSSARIVNTVVTGNLLTGCPAEGAEPEVKAADKAWLSNCQVGGTGLFEPGSLLPRLWGQLWGKGDNAAVSEATDLRGNPRIVGRNVDIGCYESVCLPGLMLIVR